MIRLLPQGTTIVPEADEMTFEVLNWADFHNGIAAALRNSSSTGEIESLWISFNRPTELLAYWV